MAEESRIADRLLIVSVVLVGLNVLGFFWFSASLSSMSAALRQLRQDREESRSVPPDLPPATAETPPAEPASVNVSPAAGLKVEGVRSPMLCVPQQVDLADQTAVIGVEVNGEPRAYVVEAFEVTEVQTPQDLSAHVVNDVLGHEAIVVTHCNLTHSTRVLAHDGSAGDPTEQLDVCVGGFQKGMLLVVNDEVYPHHASDVPLRDVPFLTTTWREWIEEHPDSLVYTGQPCDPDDVLRSQSSSASASGSAPNSDS